MQFVKESVIEASVEEVFAFHARLPEAFEKLQPPWETSEIVHPPTSLEVGTRVELRTKVAPLIWVTIVAEHVAYEENVRFEDVMRSGPFAKWHHKHLFSSHPRGCVLRDEVDYEPPLGPLGRLSAPFAVQPRLRKMFDYRHEVTNAEVRRLRGTT